jgi:hypothetical protein
MPGADDVLVAARTALFDALAALGEHTDEVTIIGAQAIYLHTGAADVALADATKDSDLVLDPRTLADDPRLEEAMTGAGFHQDLENPQPGAWLSPTGIPVDLMVPEALAGPQSRRSGRIPPHANHATRRAVGLEAAVIDRARLPIRALDPDDDRDVTAYVAGPAALLVAKLHMLAERLDQSTRLLDSTRTRTTSIAYSSPSAPMSSLDRWAVCWPRTSARRSPGKRWGTSPSSSRLDPRRWEARWQDAPKLLSATLPRSRVPSRSWPLT